MNKKHITPEIIELSKKIAEYWRMEIYKGCWVINKKGVYGVVILSQGDAVAVHAEADYVRYEEWNLKKKVTPIPSISDCLEKLRERPGFMSGYYKKKDFDNSLLNIFKNYIKGRFIVEEVHYWLLSALLRVLEKGEKQ